VSGTGYDVDHLAVGPRRVQHQRGLAVHHGLRVPAGPGTRWISRGSPRSPPYGCASAGRGTRHLSQDSSEAARRGTRGCMSGASEGRSHGPCPQSRARPRKRLASLLPPLAFPSPDGSECSLFRRAFVSTPSLPRGGGEGAGPAQPLRDPRAVEVEPRAVVGRQRALQARRELDGAAVLLERRLAARAGDRRFRRLSALRAHTKAPYKTDLHRRTLRALNRPGTARTAARRGAARPRARSGSRSASPRLAARNQFRRFCFPGQPTRVPIVTAALVAVNSELRRAKPHC
jgi:hypothetical protein